MTTIPLQQPAFQRPPVSVLVAYVRFGPQMPGKLPFTRATVRHIEHENARPSSPEHA